MNLVLFAAGLYLLSCVPMYVAGKLPSPEAKGERMILLTVDALLTIAAFTALYLAVGFWLTLGAVVLMSCVGQATRNAGYDPYQIRNNERTR